jgi:hypothetical protein
MTADTVAVSKYEFPTVTHAMNAWRRTVSSDERAEIFSAALALAYTSEDFAVVRDEAGLTSYSRSAIEERWTKVFEERFKRSKSFGELDSLLLFVGEVSIRNNERNRVLRRIIPLSDNLKQALRIYTLTGVGSKEQSLAGSRLISFCRRCEDYRWVIEQLDPGTTHERIVVKAYLKHLDNINLRSK